MRMLVGVRCVVAVLGYHGGHLLVRIMLCSAWIGLAGP